MIRSTGLDTRKGRAARTDRQIPTHIGRGDRVSSPNLKEKREKEVRGGRREEEEEAIMKRMKDGADP